MKKSFLSALVTLCLILCSFGGCVAEQKSKFTANSFDYFDTVTVITGYEKSQAEFDKVSNEIMSQLAEYNQLYSIYHRFDGVNNLCTVNELVEGEHKTVKVDKAIIDLLLYAKQMHSRTNGMLNVAMGSVLKLWHDYRTIGMDNPAEAALPPESLLKEAALHTDINCIVINEKASTVTITDPKATLDVGAIAKGFAVEQVALALEKKGISGYVINVGGNVRTVGAKPDGSLWTVGVESSTGEDYIAYLQLESESVVTSGSYQRYYVVDGKKYHHIIHPDTLMPAELGFVSVSVVCKDSGLGDALSTALFCMPKDEGLKLIESITDAEAMWVAEDGSLAYSSGWKEYMKDKE